MQETLWTTELIIFGLMVCLIGTAYAQQDKNTSERELSQGIQAYQNGNFDQAIDYLASAIARELPEQSDLIKAYKYMGLSYVAKDRTRSAKTAFERAIKLNPNLTLDANYFSPKVIKIFTEVKNKIVRKATITSTPGGALVYLDGEFRGETSDADGKLVIDAIIVGKYKIEMRKKYYRTVSSDIVVYDKTKFDYKLEKVEIDLRLRTMPGGANVKVDGGNAKLITEITPTRILVDMGEEFILKLKKKGYIDKNLKIKVEEKNVLIGATPTEQKNPIFDNAGTIHIELEKKPPGNLIVRSTPEEVEVYIDGSRKGNTPLELALNEGDHTIKFRKKPFDDFTKEVRVVSEKTLEIHGVLGGNIKIESKTPDAQIFLNKKFIATTPFETSQLTKGIHELIVKKSGYTPAVLSVPVSNQKTSQVEIKLHPHSGSIIIQSDPTAATVYFDGENSGLTPLTLYGIPVGRHNISLKKDGYEIWQKDLFVENLKVIWKNVFLRLKEGDL